MFNELSCTSQMPRYRLPKTHTSRALQKCRKLAPNLVMLLRATRAEVHEGLGNRAHYLQWTLPNQRGFGRRTNQDVRVIFRVPISHSVVTSGKLNTHMNTAQIDSVILSAVGERWTKVAMVIARVVNAFSHGLPPGDEGCEVISRRIQALVHDGRLVAQGDTNKWRFSEVRLKRK